MPTLRRRELLAGAAAVATPLPRLAARAATGPAQARPLPLPAVRLKPSDHARAVETNRAYLHRLQPDRLLHNFRKFAGLEPKEAVLKAQPIIAA